MGVRAPVMTTQKLQLRDPTALQMHKCVQSILCKREPARVVCMVLRVKGYITTSISAHLGGTGLKICEINFILMRLSSKARGSFMCIAPTCQHLYKATDICTRT